MSRRRISFGSRARATRGLDYAIEPDASAASYFFGVAAVTGGTVTVEGLNRNALQGDVGFVDALVQMGCPADWGTDSITLTGKPLRGIDVDMNAISDTAQTLACVAVFAEGPTRIRNVAHMRLKETDRVKAVVTELRRLGVRAEEHEDGLTIHPGPDHTGDRRDVRRSSNGDELFADRSQGAGRSHRRSRMHGEDLSGVFPGSRSALRRGTAGVVMKRSPQRREPDRQPAPARPMEPTTARELAFACLQAFDDSGVYLADSLDRLPSPAVVAPDRALAMELSYTVLRRRATIDAVLRQLVDRDPASVERDLWTVLQLGVVQMLLMPGLPVHAAVHETVELAKRVNGRWGGMVNGVLRSLQRLLTADVSDAPSPSGVPLVTVAAGRRRAG